MLRDFETFLERGHDLRILLSTMGNEIHPDHLIHIKNVIPSIALRVYHPPEIPYEQDPPDFHVKVHLFQRGDGAGSLLIDSSNFTWEGFCSNVEWNYFSAHEVNLPFHDSAPFCKAVQTFAQYWEKSSVEITEEFIQSYRARFCERPL